MITVYLRERFGEIPPGPDFDAQAMMADAPSAHLICRVGGEAAARCSVWWEGTPVENGVSCGAVGHFSARGPEEAEALLEAACALLREKGCRTALAPMNGNTWHSYRYATGGMERPPFLMEPPADRGRSAFLEGAGFVPINHYVSYLEDLRENPEAAGMGQRLEERGYRLRPLEIARLEEELNAVYDLAVMAFRENPHYTDLPRSAFVRQYLAYGKMIIPELVLLAHKGDALAGFLFAIPDYLESREKPVTILLKTMAVLPSSRGEGLGGALMALVKEEARKLGFQRAIGALIYRGNLSERFCRAGEPLREYTLYGRSL